MCLTGLKEKQNLYTFFIIATELFLCYLSACRQTPLSEVLQVKGNNLPLFVLQGYAAEMDNPLMAHLISPELQNKKDILFGNMDEIYHFHNRSGFAFRDKNSIWMGFFTLCFNLI